MPFGSGVVGGGIPSFDLGLPDISTVGLGGGPVVGNMGSPVSPVMGPLGGVVGNNQSFFDQPMMFFSPADLMSDEPLEDEGSSTK